MTARTFVFPASLGEGLRAIDGVGEVQLVRSVRVLVRNTPIMVVATDVGSLARRAKLPPVEGDSEEMYRLTAEGKGVLASENFARLQGVRMGEMLEIPAPEGTLKLPVVGIVRDFSDQQGSLLIQRDVFVQYWRDDSVNVFRIYLKPGAKEAEVRQRILDAFGSRQRLFVLTNRDLRNYVIRLTDQWFGLTYVQIAVAVLVAVLGIVNALTVSITDRRREIGRAARGGRNAPTDSSYGLDGGDGRRSDRADPGSGAGRDSALLQRGNCAPRFDRHRYRICLSGPNRAGAGSGDSVCRVSRRAGAG